MKKYTQEELDMILAKHKKWLSDEEGGEKADLRYADLSYTDLRYAYLRYANLSSAYLRSADLSYTDLSYTDLSYANLRSADLRYANLSSADLSSADLRSANLSSADLRYAVSNLKFISLSCIGSRKGMTTYCFDNDTIWCGCFKGTLQEFEEKVNKEHKDNEKYFKEYTGAINYIKFLKEV